MDAHNFPGLPIQGEPNPVFFLLVADKRPGLVTLDREVKRGLGHDGDDPGDGGVFFVGIVLEPALREAGHAGNPGQRDFL